MSTELYYPNPFINMRGCEKCKLILFDHMLQAIKTLRTFGVYRMNSVLCAVLHRILLFLLCAIKANDILQQWPCCYLMAGNSSL